jgi:hypothetical protein
MQQKKIFNNKSSMIVYKLLALQLFIYNLLAWIRQNGSIMIVYVFGEMRN